MNSQTYFILVTAIAISSNVVTRTVASDFYDASCETRAVVKDFQQDFGASGNGKEDDSKELQNAIDTVSKGGGGVISIPAGNYTFSGIELNSNVHLEIDKAAVISPWIGGATKSVGIFNCGSDTLAIENISIKGIGGKFTVKLPEYEPGIRVFSMSNVRNFLISNCHVEDQRTKFSSVQFGASGLKRGQRAIPTSGTVQNISVVNAHYGYGVVQTQAAHNVLFENLSGVGGATLRLETGYKLMNDVQYGGLKNIVGRNIGCEDGNAAVMISPHAMTNGVVTIDGVTTKGCGFGVRIDSGFVSKKYKAEGLKPGTFAEGSSVKNVTATFGMNAQIKPKHFKYMPLELRGQLQSMDDSEDGESVRGPSIAAMLNDANYEVTVENVQAKEFEYAPAIMTEKDARNDPARKKAKRKQGKAGGKKKNRDGGAKSKAAAN